MSARTLLAWFGTVGLVLLAMTGAVGTSTHVNVRASTTEPRQEATPPVADPGPAVTPAPGPPLRMLFVGASITSGVGASRPDIAFPALVERTIQDQVGRATTAVVAHSGAVVEETTRWDLPAAQDVLVVHMVTNDFEKVTPLPSYRDHMRGLLTRLRGSSPRARLICLGAWEPSGARNKAGLVASAYDTIARTGCEEHGGVFVSLALLFAQPTLRSMPARNPPAGQGEDGFHPNDTGHQRIATDVLDILLAGRTLDHPHSLVQVGAVVRYR